MQRCVELAREAQQAGDKPFGAVITGPDGRPVAEGRNRELSQLDVTAHAEIDALRRATARLQTTQLAGYTMYASGQPCPMCQAAIRLAGMSRVVFGARSARDSGRALELLEDPGISEAPPPAVLGGVMERECLQVQGRLQ